MEDDKGLRAIAHHLQVEDVLLLSKRRHEGRMAKLAEQNIDLTMPAAEWLSSGSTPGGDALRHLVPIDLSVEGFCHCTTEDDVVEAARRRVQCERCSVRGGECEGDHDAGHHPIWETERGFRWVRCKRWHTTYRIDKMLRRSGYPERVDEYELASFNAYTGELSYAKGVANEYIDDYEENRKQGVGLVIYGTNGIGKTHLAVSVARELVERQKIVTTRFWDFREFMEHLRKFNDESRASLEESANVDLLVLDDLNDVADATPWMVQQVGTLVNNRWRNRLPMIVTTNDPLPHYTSILGPRTVSRLVECLITLDFEGDDYRIKKVTE